MAYMKIVPIKTNTHLQQVFDYIENPDKTEESVYVSSYLCDYKTAVEDFREIHRLAIKRATILHITLSSRFRPRTISRPKRLLK